VKVISFLLNRGIWWNVDRSFPRVLKIRGHEQLKFINPVLYKFIEGAEFSPFTSNNVSTVGLNGAVLVCSSNLCFLVNDNYTLTEESRLVHQLLQKLRWISKQALIDDQINLYTSCEIDKLPRVQIDNFEKRLGSIRTHIIDTAIKYSDVQRAVRLIDIAIPAYSTVFLDAIAAFHRGDYKTSVLYSAIAMDAAARNMVNKEYQQHIKRKRPASFLRISSRRIDKNNVKTEDAVYAYLTQNDRFKQWLHEIPLYLLKRSLKFDNNVLYTSAIKLYEIRNGFVHTGLPVGSG
jgi:hypothetical protein